MGPEQNIGGVQIDPVVQQQLPRLLTERLGHKPLDDNAGIDRSASPIPILAQQRDAVGLGRIRSPGCDLPRPLAELGEVVATIHPLRQHMADLSLQRALVRLRLCFEPSITRSSRLRTVRLPTASLLLREYDNIMQA